MLFIIQLIISVVVVYLIFSIIVYVVVEWIAGALQLRGRNLQNAILGLFNDAGNKPFGELIYKHPQVSSLVKNDTRLPSYIPAANVAAALVDLVSADAGAGEKISTPYAIYLEGLLQLNDGPLKTLLVTLAQQADGLPALTAALGKWYDDYMDRVSGWYKKKIRLVVLVVSLLVTVGFNVDTIYILQAAKSDPATRQRINTLADKLIADSSFNHAVANAADTTQTIHSQQLRELIALEKNADLPVGWGIKKSSRLFELLGWLLTTLALSAGAPFWFDMLKKLVNIRNAGPKPEGSAG